MYYNQHRKMTILC
ncbi:hypothetical protein V2J09_011331 [Rumex salicifolius]